MKKINFNQFFFNSVSELKKKNLDRIIKLLDFNELIVLSGKKEKYKYSGEDYKGHKSSINNFVQSLSNDKPIINFNDIIHGMNALFAIKESIHRGKSISLK